MGCDWSICRNLNALDEIWLNQEQMRQSEVGKWRVGVVLQVPSDLWLC